MQHKRKDKRDIPVEYIDKLFGIDKQDCQKSESEEDDVSFAHNTPDTIPEGEYLIQVIEYEINAKYKGEKKLYLHAEVMPPSPYAGTELYMTANMGHKRFGASTKFYKTWVVANRGEKPKRRDRMSMRVFKDAIFKAIVRTVKSDDGQGVEYSIIDHLIERID